MVTLQWLQISYKVPPEPATKRVALWRRLKSMGAVYLRDGVCLLPNTNGHLRRLRMIENEISEMGGEAVMLKAAGIDLGQEERVVRRFNADRNAQYEEFLGKCRDYKAEIDKEIAQNNLSYAELEENEQDLTKLKRWLEKIVRLDFYGTPLAQDARTGLAECEALLEEFSQQVFAARDERAGGEAEEG
jgi:hypothetical protein